MKKKFLSLPNIILALSFMFYTLGVASIGAEVDHSVRVSKEGVPRAMPTSATAPNKKQALQTYASYMCGSVDGMNSPDLVFAALNPKTCISTCRKTGALYHFEVRDNSVVQTGWSATESKRKEVLSGCKIADKTNWRCRETSSFDGKNFIDEFESRSGHIVEIQVLDDRAVSFCFIKQK